MKQLKPVCYWPKMKESFKEFIRQCKVCQRHKMETTYKSIWSLTTITHSSQSLG
jgi:hypothetical protein